MAQLIARDEQLNQLNTILQKALQGSLQIVFVTGEAGAGKTVLIEAFIERVRRRVPELLTAGSKCHAIAGGHQEPYLPFVQILSALVTDKKDNTLTSGLRRIVTDVAPDWIAVIPVVGDVIAAGTRTIQAAQREFSDQGTGIDTQRRMVQYTNVLNQMAETVPLLLWIDDLHWSDSATLNLISFLADHASDSRIMLIATYRPTDIIHTPHGQPHPAKPLVSKLKRYQQSLEVPVPNFSRADVESLLSLSRHQFPEPFVERLWRHSGGNPLFVRQYITLLHAQRLLKREGGAFVLVQPDLEVEIPTTVQAVIEQRLSLIGEDMRRVLSVASVQGERFTSRILTNLLSISELDVLEKLNLLERVHKLIRELEEQHFIVKAGTQYQFIHALVQKAVYDDLGTGQRRHLHLTIAQLLENLYGEEAEQHAADIAIHFERGADLARAIEYHLQASRNALDILALDDALDHAKAARRLAAQMGEDERTAGWHIEALIRIAEAYYRKAKYEAGLEVCDQGEALCQQGSFVEQHAALLYWRSNVLYSMGRRGNTVKPAKQALQILGDTPVNRRLEGDLYAHLGSLYYVLPLGEAQQALEAALSIAEAEQLPDVKAAALMEKAWVAMNRTDKPEEALQFSQEVLAIAQSQNMIYEQIHCHRLIAYASRRLKQGEKALLHNQLAVTIAKQSGMPRLLQMALSSLALSLKQVSENWLESLEVMHEAVALAQKYHFPVSRDVLLYPSYLTIGLGRWSEVEQVHNDYRRSIDASSPRSWGSYYRQLGHLAYARGLFIEAVEAYKRAFALLDEHGSDERDFRAVQPYLGLALLEIGDLQQAVKHLKEAYSYWQDRGYFSFAGSLRSLARVDLAQGNPADAVTRLREALVVIKGSYGVSWPHVCIDLGRALLATGETNEALQHALAGYGKFKKWGHFLLGEAAFVVGQILVAQGKPDEALAYLHEARDDWERLELTHHLPAWEAFMEEHGLA